VLTTCAVDYLTWADYYEPGENVVNGLRVLRFPVPEPRDAETFEAASERAYAAPKDRARGRAWMHAQGPNAPGLLHHLRKEGRGYDAVVFVTYLYATTADGLPLVADRSLLVPTVHDEPPLRLAIFDEVFAKARLCLFSTPEERELARKRFGVPDDRARIVGSGIDEYPDADGGRFIQETRIDRPYALYHGRLDPSKGVPELVEHHVRYRVGRPDALDLVLIGGGEISLPTDHGFHRLGFVSEERKQTRSPARRSSFAPRRTRVCHFLSSRRGLTGAPRSRTRSPRSSSVSRGAPAAGSGTRLRRSTPPCSTSWLGRNRSPRQSEPKAIGTRRPNTAGTE
jgi:glycosyltransferase involved in cell wall biosynthesis